MMRTQSESAFKKFAWYCVNIGALRGIGELKQPVKGRNQT
jgi:hypothetical protein